MKHKDSTRIAQVLAGLMGAGATLCQADSPPGQPLAPLLDPQLVVHCPERQAPELKCSYRISPPHPIDDVDALTEDGRPVSVELRPYPEEGDTSAVLLLVDTGDPEDTETLSSVSTDLVRVIGRGQSHHRIALATLDSELEVRHPFGAGRQDLLRAVKALAPTGRTSELYRNTLSAVRLLAREEASRRALYLVSDGMADDKAYFHQDVVEAARAAGVSVYGLGYAGSPRQVPALQTLRRLSEDTGGSFVAAGESGHLPNPFLEAPFAALDSGGKLRARVPTIPAFRSELMVELKVTSAGQVLRRSVSVTPPPLAPGETATEPGGTSSAQASPLPPSAPPRPAAPWREREPTLGVEDLLVLTGTILLFGASAVFLWRRRSHPKPAREPGGRPVAPPPPASAPARAYLTLPTAPRRGAFRISTAGIQIGRNADNDVQLDDPSVSRHHARIGWDSGTGFHIADQGSLNGIYVNDQQVKNTLLKNGDRLEVGDIRLEFHLGEPPAAPADTDPEHTAIAPREQRW